MILGIILFAILNYATGYPLYRIFFTKTNSLEKIFLPQIFSLILTPAIFALLLFIAGFDNAIIILPFISIGIFSVSVIKFKQKKDEMKVYKHELKLIAAFFLVFLALFFLGFQSHAFSRITDSHFHSTVINEIKNNKSLPPDTACLTGERLKYSWFPHLDAALISIYTGLSTFTVFSFYGMYLFILFAFSVLILAKQYLKENTKATLVLMTILYTYFFASYHLFGIQSYALPILILFFCYILRSFGREESQKYKLLSGLLTASLAYIHGLSFVFSILTLFAIFVYDVRDLFNRKETPLFYILPLVLAIPFYLFVSGSGDFFIFQPLSGLFLLISNLQFFSTLLIVLPFAAIAALKGKNNEQTHLLFIIIAASIFVLMFIMASNLNISRNITLLIMPVSLFTVYYVKDFQKKILLAILIIFIIPHLNVHASDIANTISSPNFFTSSEYMVSQWIGNNSLPADRFAASTTSIYSSVSQRKPVICNEDFLRQWSYNPERLKKAFVDNLAILSRPSRQLVNEYNIKYIVFGDREKQLVEKYDLSPYSFNSSTAFKPEYMNGNYTVYSISDSTALPEKTELNISLSPYSRWWEI